jgi:hypothetical protein
MKRPARTGTQKPEDGKWKLLSTAFKHLWK